MGGKNSKTTDASMPTGEPIEISLDTIGTEIGEKTGEEGEEESDGKPNVRIVDASHFLNQYTTKKTVTSGLLNLSLLSANASQIKTVCQNGPKVQQFYYFLLVFLVISVLLQVSTAVLLMFQGKGDVEDETEDGLKSRKRLNFYGNIAAVFAMLTAVVNVFVTTFMDEHSKEATTGG